jgi:ParB-like nuclease family protein
MLNDFFLYLAGIFVLVGGVLRLERTVVGPHSTAGSGYARVDSAFDFDRLRRKQHGARAPSALPRRARPILPSLREEVHNYRHLRDAGEQFIPIASIVGSVDGGSQLFDRNFRPVSDRARARLGGVVAMRQGEPLPPIEVYAWRGRYYVLDGHHRVAAARALGSDVISAHVIEVS